MKKSILLIAAIFSMAILVTSCKETKKEKEEVEMNQHEHSKDASDEVSSGDVYQCPMDCEDGKTYDEAGPCPVCKMDLKKQTAANEQAAKCSCGKDGECKCESKPSTKMACANCEPGSCTCKGDKGAEEATAVKQCSGACEPGTCKGNA